MRIGVVAGLVGGVAAALVLLAVGEQSITDAIAIEEAASPSHEEPLVTRPGQLVGGVLGSLLVSAALGVVFAVVFARLRHRLPGRDDWRRALVLGGAGYVAVALVPFLKYPANPPAVGDPDTITERTVLYLVMVAISLCAVWIGRQITVTLAARGASEPARITGGVAAWAAIVIVAFVVVPGSPDAVEAPATLLWRFRLASAAGQVAFWTTMSIGFGWLAVHKTRTGVAQFDISHSATPV